MPPITPPVEPPGMPPGTPPDDAGSAQIRGRFFFFDHLNFFRNLGRRAQLAIDQFALNLHDLHGRSRRRRGRRRWRWRSDQERHQLLLGQRIGVNQRDQDQNARSARTAPQKERIVVLKPLGLELVSGLNKAVFKHGLLLHQTLRDLRHQLHPFCSRSFFPASAGRSMILRHLPKIGGETLNPASIDLNFFLRLARPLRLAGLARPVPASQSASCPALSAIPGRPPEWARQSQSTNRFRSGFRSPGRG